MVIRGLIGPFFNTSFRGIYMKIEDIIEKFKNRVPRPIDIKKEYAVLIPLIYNQGQWEIIYELRSNNITQPGEISFPGGGLEEGETYKQAAIRETMEELNIEKENIQVIGELDYLVSYDNVTIHCFLGIISGVVVDKIQPNKDEVDHIFTVPLDHFLETEPDTYYLGLKTVLNDEFPYNLIPNGRDYSWRDGKRSVQFYYYKDYIIWGYTAKMTRQFIDIIKGPMDL